ncbi:MAG: ComF family protein [Clostridiales bacterium]|nr:ComF family protein [Clostridiales bacterium]
MSKLTDGALAMLFPQRLCCHGCGCMLAAGEELLCAACREKLDRCTLKRKDEHRQFKPEQLLAAAAYAYDGMAAELARSLKYASDKAAAIPLAEGMARRFALMPQLRAAEVCVAVPSFPRQAQRRGYSQAQVLCGAFAGITGLPQAQALRRIRFATSQVGKSRDERRKQIIGAFVFDEARTGAVRDKCVLLIDDVLTTGATACECARMLYAAGARRVLALTACRA